MKSFFHLNEIPAITRSEEHGGKSEIHFRRISTADDFESPIDFVDFTVVPPQSTIGWHSHVGNEEAYFIAAGNPLVRVDRDKRQVSGNRSEALWRLPPRELALGNLAPIKIGRPRDRDIPRHFGSIERLKSLGFAPRFSLQQSLTDSFSYYCHYSNEFA